MRSFVFCLLLLHAICVSGQGVYQYKRPETSIRIAIIIDDIGYNIPLGKRTVDIPAALTLAVLPHTPGAKKLAEAGFASGKEIMLHAPMSNQNDKALGPGALTPDMNKQQLTAVLRDSIDAIPHIHGVNNHMGSELTTLEQPMQWVMEELKSRQLFFIDSLTNSDSVALKTARNAGVTAGKRDIFLDHEQDEVVIERAFHQLIQLAHRNGYAIAIGHPHPETLNVLERLLPKLDSYGVKLVPASEILLIK